MIDLVVDIETTGLLYSKYDRQPYDLKTGYLKDDREILEVGYLRVDDDTADILSSGTLYFYKPYFQIENEAFYTHGLTREFLQQYEGDFETNLVKLTALIQKTNIIGKNSTTFDVPFINGFIEKHSDSMLKLDSVVSKAAIKTIDGMGFLSYNPMLFQTDVQKVFREKFFELYYEKYKVMLDGRKKGTLMEYIDVLNAEDEVDKIYDSLDKDRVTKAHGALYDCVATYVVWKNCVNMGLLRRN